MIRVRKAGASDIDAVAEIEERQFLHPWKRSYLIDELSHDISYFYVAEDETAKGVVGYIIFWIIEEMLELHHIAVPGKYKKKGIGKELFLFMLKTAEQNNVEEIFLEVRKSNAEAVAFYESFDFELVGVRKNYYSSPPGDALIYKWTARGNIKVQ